MHCGGVLFYGIFTFLSVCILFQSGIKLSSYLWFVLIQLWNHLTPIHYCQFNPTEQAPWDLGAGAFLGRETLI